MKLPRFTNTLHFRISALFLLLLAISSLVLWFWVNAVLNIDWSSEEEETWFMEQAAGELDNLASTLSSVGTDTVQLRNLAVDYGRRIERFGAEIVVFDPAGTNLTSSQPESLGVIVPIFDAQLLLAMSSGTWDFSTFPIAENQDAYGNRIFHVTRLTLGSPVSDHLTGFLAASYRPFAVDPVQVGLVDRTIFVQATVLLLIYAALSGLIILTWTSRRIRKLSEGVTAFAGGNLSHRVPSSSADEIGSLGRSFNNMAQRLEDMVEKLRQKEKFQRQLIANVSHDLRTPLSSMKGYLETLQFSCVSCDQAEPDRYIQIISSNLEYLDRLIERMLVLSRFDTGQAVFQMEEFHLEELTDAVMLRCQGLAEQQQVSLHLDCEPDLRLVHADPLQIGQVLQNLLENGIKFNQPGGEVRIKLASCNVGVQITIQDNGQGIPTADLPHIFERFFTVSRSRSRQNDQNRRSTSAKHLGQNSGLGLAIAAKIVARHDSWLKVDSELGQGTSFRFTLATADSDPEPVE